MTQSTKGNVPTLAGWAVTVLVGVGVFFLLRNTVGYHVLSSAGFGLAASLFILLLLTGSSRPEAPHGDPRVRKIVPQAELVQPPEPVAPVKVGPASVEAAAEVAVTVSPAAPEPQSGTGPLRLSAARGGKADDLKELEGIGPALEKQLNALGIYHFDQIAGWSDADIAAVDADMKTFKGRITRDRWVAQAKIIVTEGLAAFRERAKTNDY